MRLVALISGGKDSSYNMMQCVAAGHQIVALANLRPADKPEAVSDELDSYMYQTVGHEAIDLYGEAMGLPLYRHTIKGSSVDTGKVYTKCQGDEVEDLHELLKLVKDKEGVEGVSVGAILSDYQRVRVESVCKRLNLQPLAFLWHRNQEELLKEMLLAHVDAVIIKVAALGLDPDKHLGKTLAEMQPYLVQLSLKYGVHVCGEGGEYETFTLDCPLFRKKIVVDSSEVVIHSADAFAPVAYLRFTQSHLEDKEGVVSPDALPGIRCPCQPLVEGDSGLGDSEEEAGDEAPSTGWKSLEPDSISFCGRLECTEQSFHGHRWISGITASRTASAPGGVDAAAQEAFQSLREAIVSKDLQLGDIALVHLYVKSMKDFVAINAVYDSQFHVCPPARVCVEVQLPEDVLFSLDCLVCQPEVQRREGGPRLEKQVMHVQSISHWAPANIGPYSQAVQLGEAIYCSGQIALVPCTMQLVRGGIRTQAALSLGHVEKILEAMSHGMGLQHVIAATCYVTRLGHIPAACAAWLKGQTKSEAEDAHVQEQRAGCGTLAVVVVPALPRGASIEWHVIAAVDDPQQRRRVALTARSEDWQIECEAMVSSCGSCASVSVTQGCISPPVPSAVSPAAVRQLLDVFQQALEQLSLDSSVRLLCSRAFYRMGCMDAGTLRIGLHTPLKEMFFEQAPVVVLVPVLDLPDNQVLHVGFWLST